MASKLAVVAALFVCFLVADASFHVTTTIVEDENPQQYQQCGQQLQRQRLQSCQRFVSSQQQRAGRWDIMESNPQQSVQQCCQELQQIDRECRCEALEQIQEKVQQEQRQEQVQQEQRQEQGSRFSGSRTQGQRQRIQQQVRQIPQMCSIEVPQQCQQQRY